MLLVFSISMPAQDLPALQRDPSITTGSLPNGISYYLVTDSAMKGVADFALVRRGMTDTLAARRELSELPHFTKVKPYEYLSSKGIGLRKEGYISYEGDATIFRFEDVPVFDKGVSDTTLLMLFDLIAVQPRQHAVIVVGDIKTSEIIERMNVFSLMVLSRNPDYARPEYKWVPGSSTEYSFTGSGESSLTVDFRSPRTPPEQMNTIQPFISELFLRELKEVVYSRLYESLISRNIPASRLSVKYTGSADSPCDEHFTVMVETSGNQVLPATMAVSSTLSEIASKGIGPDEYRTAREAVLGELSKPQDKDGLVRRCISSYLYGADLSSPSSKAGFFSSRNMSPDAELSLFNNYSKALLGAVENAFVSWSGNPEDYDEWLYDLAFKTTWNGVSMLAKPTYRWKVSAADTSGFYSDRNKLKIKNTATEPVSGGQMFTFSNGIRVIYKQMATGGRFSYSLMLKGGLSSVKDLPYGEGAFFSDVLPLYDVAGLSGRDFDKVLKANGVEMKCKVSVSDMRLYGTAPSNRLSLVLKSLLSVANSRKMNERAFESYRKMESAGLEKACLDSLMYPGYNYAEVKTPSGLTAGILKNADAFFSNQFIRVNDGVLVLVGDLPAESMQKILVRYLGGFRVSRSSLPRQIVPYKMRTGVMTYTMKGSPVGISIGMAGAIPFTTENYMAFRIAGMALKRRITGAMARQGYSVELSDRFSIYPQEAVEMIFNLSPVSDEGLPESVSDASGHPMRALTDARRAVEEVLSEPMSTAELNACKSLITNEWSTFLSDPSNYMDVILLLFSVGKDVLTDYTKRIGSVSADKVKEIFGALSEGMRIEYVVKPQ